MAGNLSWEAKVDSILRQTGDNLERLKVQLHGQTEQSAWMHPPLRGAEQAAAALPVHTASISLPLGEGNYNAAAQQLVAQRAVLRNAAAIARDEQRKSAAECNPLVLHGLTMRLNQQEMEIASLRSALAKMEERNKEHEGLIQQLKVESGELRSRLADQGVHITTEGKFEQWKAQMMAKVQSLYSAASAHDSVQRGHSEDREGVVQLAHELQKAKISTSGDIHWLNQELRALETQLGQLELQVASLQCSIGQLQNDAEYCKSQRAKQQRDHSQQAAQIRWDLKSLEHHGAHCKHELPLQGRSQHNEGQTASRRSGSGDGGGRKEQEETLGEGESFNSEGSSREGETMDKDVSALSLGSLREESPTDLSSSDLGTPTLQLNSSSDC